MELNDGSQYRVVTDPAKYMAERSAYCFRAVSARDGVMYVDTAFAHHRETLAPLPALLMYQYVWQNAGTPETQAGFLCDLIGELRPNEMVMLDIETGGGITDPADFAHRWLAVVEGRLGCRSWLYVPRALNAALAPVVDGRVVMAPKYSGTATRGAAPDWPHDVHQYTDRGYFPGCPDPAGGDVSYTALAAADLLARSRPEGNQVAGYLGGNKYKGVAPALDALLGQLNARAPKRSKLSDGALGNAAHAATVSFHNPNPAGIVQARDYTHDPANGLDTKWLAKALTQSGDPRILEIISNRQYWTPKGGWVPYTGSNPHDKHLHLSVRSEPSLYNSTAPWNLGDSSAPDVPEDDMAQADRDLINYRVDQLAGFILDALKAERAYNNQRFNDIAGHVTGQAAGVTKTLLEALNQLPGITVTDEQLRPLVAAALDTTVTEISDEAARKAADALAARLQRPAA